MAKIFKLSSDVNTTPNALNMQTLVENYWGSASAEKLFPIALWKIQQMIAISTAEEVALKVTDITNLALVNAEWVVFEDGDEISLSDPFRPDDYYFVINEDTIERIRNGAISAGTAIENIFIGGRIGREAEQFFAFFYGYQCTPILPGTGGGGATSGIKIPPQP
ncbi:MAG: hypothetical protein SFU99_13990 [Saprospiraceae bacterium]|nr:hypothetical protein [Saprospiraceae bacterium]